MRPEGSLLGQAGRRLATVLRHVRGMRDVIIEVSAS